jgi:hypothetical protein
LLGNDGGIWAELLADRKFFHPLDDDATPSGGSPHAKVPAEAAASGARAKGSPLTRSPWRVAAAADAQVTSPRLPAKALVRSGRVAAFRFPCPPPAAPQREPPPDARLQPEHLAGAEADDEADGSGPRSRGGGRGCVGGRHARLPSTQIRRRAA